MPELGPDNFPLHQTPRRQLDYEGTLLPAAQVQSRTTSGHACQRTGRPHDSIKAPFPPDRSYHRSLEPPLQSYVERFTHPGELMSTGPRRTADRRRCELGSWIIGSAQAVGTSFTPISGSTTAARPYVLPVLACPRPGRPLVSARISRVGWLASGRSVLHSPKSRK